jgi:hypothetical protein
MTPAAARAAGLNEELVERLLAEGDREIEAIEAAADNDNDERLDPYDFREDFWLAKPYFSDEFASDVCSRYGHHQDFWSESSVGQTVWNAYRAYHNLSGVDGDPVTQLQATGEVGELLAMSIPHYRTLVRHQIALFTSQRPAWDPQARTADAEAARQVPMAGNLLEFIANSGDLDPRLLEQVELMMVAGEGYFVTGWNANSGLGGRGWFTERVYAPWEMCHERVRTYPDCSWWIYRSFESRWDWVARFAEVDPEKAEKIAKTDHSKADFATAFREYDQDLVKDDGDRIAVLHVLAKPTLACPEGRYAIVASDDLVLFDGPYPYGEDVTISRMCASEFLGTSIPYSDSWGVLAAAEAWNAMLSMLLTRVDTAGVPNFCVPEGSEIEFSDIAGGNSVWKIPPGMEKPSVVDLLQIPEAMPAIMALIAQEMEGTVGINGVTKGQPQENVSSGSMAALLQSMAQQFNSNLERAWVLNLERIGTHHIRVFQQMADEEHAISVVGADNKWTVQSFKGEELGGILRVSVKTANALSKTTAGRAEIADRLLQHSSITPQEYLRIVETGQLEPTFAGPVGELTSIKSRGEKLMRGERAPALIWDNHQLVIRELRALLNTKARDDPSISQNINAAIQEHFDLWSKLSREAPDMLAAIGCPPLPQAQSIGQQVQAMQNQVPGAPPGAPPPAAGPPPQQAKQPETDAPRGKPGPSPLPPGQQPSRTNPAQPLPAKTPDGQSVV